jgi:hypothetical protein
MRTPRIHVAPISTPQITSSFAKTVLIASCCWTLQAVNMDVARRSWDQQQQQSYDIPAAWRPRPGSATSASPPTSPTSSTASYSRAQLERSRQQLNRLAQTLAERDAELAELNAELDQAQAENQQLYEQLQALQAAAAARGSAGAMAAQQQQQQQQTAANDGTQQQVQSLQKMVSLTGRLCIAARIVLCYCCNSL